MGQTQEKLVKDEGVLPVRSYNTLPTELARTTEQPTNSISQATPRPPFSGSDEQLHMASKPFTKSSQTKQHNTKVPNKAHTTHSAASETLPLLENDENLSQEDFLQPHIRPPRSPSKPRVLKARQKSLVKALDKPLCEQESSLSI